MSIKQKALSLLIKNPQITASFDEREALALWAVDTASEMLRHYLAGHEKKLLINEILEEVLHPYRKLQTLMDEPTVEEIMVNGTNGIFVKYRNKENSVKSPLEISENELRDLVEKLLEGSGRRVDQARPLVDFRLPDGSRVHVVAAPLTQQGFTITIRKFLKETPTLKTLLAAKTISQDSAAFLQHAVEMRLNIVVSGGTSSGKTTTIGVLLSAMANDRVVIIEETTEISVPKSLSNCVSLETRSALFGQAQSISMRDLVKNALRMKPDRIIVGEVRGEETFDMLQAMNTGHPGSFTSIHANSVVDTIKRLEALILLAGFPQLPMSVVDQWIYDAVDVVVYQARFGDGIRRITHIAGIVEEKIIPLFAFENGKFKAFKKNVTNFYKKIADKRK